MKDLVKEIKDFVKNIDLKSLNLKTLLLIGLGILTLPLLINLLLKSLGYFLGFLTAVVPLGLLLLLVYHFSGEQRKQQVKAKIQALKVKALAKILGV